MKRLCTLLVALLFLVSVFALPVAAESDPITPDAPGASTEPIEPDPVEPDAPAIHPVFDQPVRHSVTDSHLSGWGLAFCFTLNVEGVAFQSEKSDAPSLTDATVVYEGEECSVTRMGTLVTNRSDLGEDATAYLREAALDDADQVKDVLVTRLYKAEADYCMYAVRVTNIPFEREDRPVYARPYVEITYGDETVTLYGAVDVSSYAEAAQNHNVMLPDYGIGIDVQNRLTVGETSVLCETAYVEIIDELDDWMLIYDPENSNYIYYACYDADGNELTLSDENYGRLEMTMNEPNATETFAITLPDGTARLEITGYKIVFWTDWEM